MLACLQAYHQLLLLDPTSAVALEGIKLISQDMQVGVSKLVHALCLHLDAKMEDEDSTEEDPAWAQLAGEKHTNRAFLLTCCD